MFLLESLYTVNSAARSEANTECVVEPTRKAFGLCQRRWSSQEACCLAHLGIVCRVLSLWLWKERNESPRCQSLINSRLGGTANNFLSLDPDVTPSLKSYAPSPSAPHSCGNMLIIRSNLARGRNEVVTGFNLLVESPSAVPIIAVTGGLYWHSTGDIFRSRKGCC